MALSLGDKIGAAQKKKRPKKGSTAVKEEGSEERDASSVSAGGLITVN